MKPTIDLLSLLLAGLVSSFLGTIVGVLFYGFFSAAFFRWNLALQNWVFPSPRDSMGVPWGMTILAAIIGAALGFVFGTANHIRKLKMHKN